MSIDECRGRWLVALAVAVAMAWVGMAAAADTVVRFAGPPSGLLSLPVYRMMDARVLEPDGIAIELVPWKSPEQLRAILLGRQADVAGMPTNLAANFHNHGAPVVLLNVAIWKAVWVVTTDSQADGLADLRGSEILVPFRGELPDILFRAAARRAGLNPDRDFVLRSIGTAQDAAALLVAGRARTAVLSEPACSVAIARATSSTLTLRRIVDVQEVLSESGMRRGLPMAGVARIGADEEKNEAIARFASEYALAADWCNQHPAEAAKLMAERIPTMPVAAVEDAIRNALMDVKSATEVRTELDGFFTMILHEDGARIGSRLPGDAFFGGAYEFQ